MGITGTRSLLGGRESLVSGPFWEGVGYLEG